MKSRRLDFKNLNGNWGALGIVALYLIIGLAWILFSDEFAAAVSSDTATFATLSVVKGWGYVVVTALLLFWLIQRHTARLRASEARYSHLFANMLEGYAHCRMIYDHQNPKDFEYLAVNKAFVELTGLKDVIGKRVTEVIPGIKDTNPELFEVYGRVAQSGVPEKLETHVPGLGIWFSLSVYSPEKGYFVAVFDNITKRKQMEQALQESERRFRALIEHSTDAIALLDTHGTITYQSPSIMPMLGFTPEEMVGRNAIELLHPEDRSQAEELLRQVIREPTSPITRRMRYLSKESTWRWVEATATNLLQEVAVNAVVVNYRDITDNVQHQRELEAIAAMSSVLRDAVTRAEMLPIVLDQVVSLLGVDAAAFVSRDRTTDESVLEVVRGKRSDLVLRRVPPREGVMGYVLDFGKPYVANDVMTDPVVFHHAREVGFKAIASVPLIAQNEVVGALWVAHDHAIPEDAVRLLTAVSDIAANAIHRASLHEQTEQQLARLETLHSIDAAIASTFDLRVILGILLQRVISQLKVDAADILLLNRNLLTLEYAAGRGFRFDPNVRMSLRVGESHAGLAVLEGRVVTVADYGAELAKDQSHKLDHLKAESFVAYCAAPLVVKGQVRGVLELFKHSAFSADSDWAEFLLTLAQQAAIAIDNAELFNGLQRSNKELWIAYDATIEGWARALDLRDRETQGHTQRVAGLTERLARVLNLNEEEMTNVRRGTLLHDIGKMGVPDRILYKPGKLTNEEWQIMHQHPQIAHDMLFPIAYLRPALDIPYCHHERWDGTGYPQGLKGEQIPKTARIFAVVDVWDALTSERPYRKAWTGKQAIKYILDQSGKHFDPHVAEAFIQNIQTLLLSETG